MDGGSQMKREADSLDDFEHLGHDSSPLKDVTGDLLGLGADVQAPARGIDNRAAEAGTALTGSLHPQKMDSNLLDMGDSFANPQEPLRPKDKFNIDDFMNSERGFVPTQPKIATSADLLDRYSDSEPEEDDFKPSKYEDFPKKHELPESFGSTENFKSDTFKDVEDVLQPQPPKKDVRPTAPAPEPPISFKEQPVASAKTAEPPKVAEIIREKTPEPVRVPETKPVTLEPVKPKTPEPVKPKTPEPVKPKTPEPVNPKTPEPVAPKQEEPKKVSVEQKKTELAAKKPKIAPAADAEAIFCKMGLDTWFNPEKLNPKVESLIYWRDPKKSGPVFGGVLLVLLALTYFSLISVTAYLSLAALSATLAFRIYKNVVQAVQKTGDGHPFREALEMDVSLPQDKVKEISEIAVAHINAAVVELRRLFLVEDLVDSIKFGVLLWTLTYLGAWFNGMTLIIIAWVALFTLPKVYETNKTQIDANLEIVRTKLAEITSKVKAAIPIGKKAEEKKEQ